MEISTLWATTLDNCELDRTHTAEKMLLQHILKSMQRSSLKSLMDDMPVKDTEKNREPLELHEEQALRYCSGYVPFKLIKRYGKLKQNKTAQKFMDVLNSWADLPDMEDSTFLEYTRQWINVQSRGGLFKVSDDVYRFF